MWAFQMLLHHQVYGNTTAVVAETCYEKNYRTDPFRNVTTV